MKKWRYILIGFAAGCISLFAVRQLIKVDIPEEIAVYEESPEMLEEGAELEKERTEESETQEKIVKEDEMQKEEASGEFFNGYYADEQKEVIASTDFAKETLMYQYIEYGLRKYSEEKGQNKRYNCNIEEDLLPYDTEFRMKNEGEEPYKIDLAKELIPELANDIYNFKLEGEDETLYMSIDTFNMKIYIYN